MIIECVICYEHLQSSEAIYHTPCGHVFHHPCLTKWFERSKTCPECREKVSAISRIYLHFSSDNADDVSTALQTEIAGLNHELLIKELEIIESNSNNTKLSALLKVKEGELGKLQAAYWIAQEDNTVWKNTVETQKKEVDAAKGDVARLTKERDELIESSKVHWEEISRMFHGIKDHGTLVEMISVMKSELATCTSTRWDLQRTVMKLQQQIEGSPDDRMFFTTERAKARQMEDNLATLEIEKIVLQKRIDDLEAINASASLMLIKDGTSGNISRRSIEQVDGYIPNPMKKLKTTTDGLNGNAGASAGPIDVIDLTKEIVQPVIDLTDTDSIEPIIDEIDVSWPLAS